jgi:predicted nucleic acid-binding protein
VKRSAAPASRAAAIVADTGGLLRALACDERGQPSWPSFAELLSASRRILVPDLVLAEVDYFLRRERLGMRKLVADILDPETPYELVVTEPPDLVRALHIDARFASLELGLVDSIVCTIAERHSIDRVLTTDIRDFTAVRIGLKYDRALRPVP